MPPAPIWTNARIPRRQVLFEGVKSEPIFYKDFLCPITATDVQSAHCVVHLYDKPVAEFVDLAVKRGMVDATDTARAETAQRLVALVKKLADNSAEPKAAVTQATRPNESYAPVPGEVNSGPNAEFAEFYMWFDANEDGIAENVMMICDRKTRAPIFYDNVANMTTDGLRPIEIVRIKPVSGRWYGVGIMEYFESYQTIVDLLVNRWNFSQSRSGRVDFWNPAKTQEGQRDPTLKLNWGGTYSLIPGATAEDVLKSVYLNDIKFQEIQTMMQFFLQLAMNESGVSSANDDQAAGMQSAKLATGIINVQQSGDELFRPLIGDLTGPLTKILDREVSVLLANMNPEEAFAYLEGDTMKIETLTKEDVGKLRFKVKISMTQHKNQETIQMSAQACALVEKFYMLSPAIQEKVAPFYRNQLRAMDPHSDVDHVIQPMPPEPPAPLQMKPALSVTAKISELNPQERAQAMKDVGIDSTGEGVAPPPSAGGQIKKQPNNASGPRLGEAGAAGSTAHATQLTQAQRPSGT
jgi:hypothetical protein